MKCIFEVKNGRPKITDHTRTIWYYNDIIDLYGEELALKIFMVFHYMADLTLENPFANISELEKLEMIIRGTCPEITEIDWNDDIIDEGIEFTRKLYETMSYRKYLTAKLIFDKTQKALQDTYINLSKDSGNSGEIAKSLKTLSELDEITKKAYNEFLDEQDTVRVRGQGVRSASKRTNTIAEELD